MSIISSLPLFPSHLFLGGRVELTRSFAFPLLVTVDLREGKQAAEVSLEQARAEAVKHMSQLRDLRSEIDERDAAVRVAGEKAALAVEKQRVSFSFASSSSCSSKI